MTKAFQIDGDSFEVTAVEFRDSRGLLLRMMRAKPYGEYTEIEFWDAATKERFWLGFSDWTPTDEQIVAALRKRKDETALDRKYKARMAELRDYAPVRVYIP